MEIGTREEICYKFLLSFIICFTYSSMSDASCSLPQDLRNKVWEYSYTSVSDSSKKVINLDIKTTTLQNSAINLEFQGTIINQWTCINSLDVSNTTTVVVFRSDNSYSKVPGGDNYRLYLCMKLTRITADLYYFYLLSDKKTDIKPNERAFESTDTDPISSTVCQYTDSPPKIRTLRKQGTNDVLPNDASLCEPWDSACDVDDMCDPNPCQNNGTCVDLSDSFNCTCAPGWEDDNCTTVMTCDDPKIVPHTTIISSGNELDDTITFSCAVGYEHISGDSVITCRSDGNWEGSPINCTKVTCQNPSAASFASLETQTGSKYLDMITYKCNTGYELASGNLVRKCKEDKLWDGSPPVCIKVTCASPSSVAFATISSQTGSKYLDTIRYICNTGYELTSGIMVRTCKADKTWDESPVCSKVTCQNPSAASFASLETQTGSKYLDMITYKCNTGYELASGNLVRKCKADKQWDGNPPVCAKITCQNTWPVAFSTISTTGNKYQDTVTYTCNTGYELTSGNLVRTCMENKNWSGNQPVCTITCPDPGESDHVTRQLNGNNPTETVVYKCDSGYDYFSGNTTRVCGSDGQWSGEKLVCRAYLAVSNEQSNYIIAGTISGLLLILAIIVIFLFCYCIVRKKKNKKMDFKSSSEMHSSQRL